MFVARFPGTTGEARRAEGPHLGRPRSARRRCSRAPSETLREPCPGVRQSSLQRPRALSLGTSTKSHRTGTSTGRARPHTSQPHPKPCRVCTSSARKPKFPRTSCQRCPSLCSPCRTPGTPSAPRPPSSWLQRLRSAFQVSSTERALPRQIQRNTLRPSCAAMQRISKPCAHGRTIRKHCAHGKRGCDMAIHGACIHE